MTGFNWQKEKGYKDGTAFTRMTSGAISIASASKIRQEFENFFSSLQDVEYKELSLSAQNEYRTLQKRLEDIASSFNSNAAVLEYGVRIRPGSGLDFSDKTVGASGNATFTCVGTPESIANHLDRQLQALRIPPPSERFASAEEKSRWYDSAFLDPKVFDPSYYLQINNDVNVACSGNATCAGNHWLLNGIQECRVGSPSFNAKWYLEQYPDIRDSAFGISCEAAMGHFLTFQDRPGAP